MHNGVGVVGITAVCVPVVAKAAHVLVDQNNRSFIKCYQLITPAAAWEPTLATPAQHAQQIFNYQRTWSFPVPLVYSSFLIYCFSYSEAKQQNINHWRENGAEETEKNRGKSMFDNTVFKKELRSVDCYSH